MGKHSRNEQTHEDDIVAGVENFNDVFRATERKAERDGWDPDPRGRWYRIGSVNHELLGIIGTTGELTSVIDRKPMSDTRVKHVAAAGVRRWHETQGAEGIPDPLQAEGEEAQRATASNNLRETEKRLARRMVEQAGKYHVGESADGMRITVAELGGYLNIAPHTQPSEAALVEAGYTRQDEPLYGLSGREVPLNTDTVNFSPGEYEKSVSGLDSSQRNSDWEKVVAYWVNQQQSAESLGEAAIAGPLR